MAAVDGVGFSYLSVDSGVSEGRDVGLSSQLRRAAISIPSNIAEGQGRLSRGEFVQFLGIARGSNFEVQTQIELARMLGFGIDAAVSDCDELSAEVGRMLNGLIRSLNEAV